MVAILHTLESCQVVSVHTFVKEVIVFDKEEDAKRFLKFTAACIGDVKGISHVYTRNRIQEMMYHTLFTVNEHPIRDIIYKDEYGPIEMYNGWSAWKNLEYLFELQFKRYKYGLVKCLTGQSGDNDLKLIPSAEIVKNIPEDVLAEHIRSSTMYVSDYITRELQEEFENGIKKATVATQTYPVQEKSMTSIRGVNHG